VCASNERVRLSAALKVYGVLCGTPLADWWVDRPHLQVLLLCSRIAD
jgi:hypothetical protein